jgi:hypothetical protein
MGVQDEGSSPYAPICAQPTRSFEIVIKKALRQLLSRDRAPATRR